LNVDGHEVRLTPEEVEIRLEAKPGWSAAQGRAGVVVVSTEITSELRDEGVIRELIHHVQAQRKELDLAYEARIRLHVAAAPAFLAILRRFADTVKSECLVTEIVESPPPGTAPLAQHREPCRRNGRHRGMMPSNDGHAPQAHPRIARQRPRRFSVSRFVGRDDRR
jgi:hypothetical protein